MPTDATGGGLRLNGPTVPTRCANLADRGAQAAKVHAACRRLPAHCRGLNAARQGWNRLQQEARGGGRLHARAPGWRAAAAAKISQDEQARCRCQCCHRTHLCPGIMQAACASQRACAPGAAAPRAARTRIVASAIRDGRQQPAEQRGEEQEAPSRRAVLGLSAALLAAAAQPRQAAWAAEDVAVEAAAPQVGVQRACG